MIAAAAVATSVATVVACSGGGTGVAFYGAANIVDASPGDDAPALAYDASGVIFYGFAFYGNVRPPDAGNESG